MINWQGALAYEQGSKYTHCHHTHQSTAFTNANMHLHRACERTGITHTRGPDVCKELSSQVIEGAGDLENN
jgi:hypothetical protein